VTGESIKIFNLDYDYEQVGEINLGDNHVVATFLEKLIIFDRKSLDLLYIYDSPYLLRPRTQIIGK
jgi:hypothetical protein